MPESPRPVTVLPGVTRVIIGAASLGGLITLAMASSYRHGFETMTSGQWLVSALFAALIFGSWLWPLVLYRGPNSEAFHLDEGIFVCLVLLLPATTVIWAFATMTIAAQLVMRRPAAKLVFNAGQVTLACGLGLAVASRFTDPSHSLTPLALAGAGLGVAAYFVANSGMVIAVMVSLGTPWRTCVLDGLFNRLAVVGGGALAGELVALVIEYHTWTLVLAVPAIIALRLVVTAQFKAQHDRSRMEGLMDVTLAANRKLREESVVESILSSARLQLRCPDALLSPVDPGPEAMAAPIDIGPTHQWLVVSGRAKQEPFDHADRVMLDAIAAIGQGALSNAELYRQVQHGRARLESITFHIGEGVCALDTDGRLTLVNATAAAMVALDTVSVVTDDLTAPEPAFAPGFLLHPAEEAMRTGRLVRVDDARWVGRDGEEIPVSYTASAMRQGGVVVGAVIAFRDITERLAMEVDLERGANYDALTDLPNRRMLVSTLDRSLERSKLDRKVHALIFIDVDRFKAINDSLGHGTGDDLLKIIGKRISQVLRSSDLLARWGGDEFVVLLEDVSGVDEAVAAARRICESVEQPLVLSDGYEIVASLSVGIALTEPGRNADDILRDADVAMYKAKGQGGTYQIFDKTSMGTRSSARFELESALRKCLDRDELEIHYQPLVSIDDLSVVGAEALVRWRHPTHGLLYPDKFIPMAEETGLIIPLGRQVLEKALAHLKAVRDDIGIEIPVSVNLSARQFQGSSLLGDVAKVLDQVGMPANLLTFEITETMVMDDPIGATEVMKKLNRLGVGLAIDDFGTGHSSLGYLKQFPVQEVKVDRMFVRGLVCDPVDSAIVEAIIRLSEAMGIIAVAEGVETEQQVLGLKMLRCPVGQGYQFSRPLPPVLFDELLQGNVVPDLCIV